MRSMWSLLAGLWVMATGCATVPAMKAPDELRVKETEIEAALLEFSPAEEGEGYVIQRKTGKGTWSDVETVGSGVSSFADEGLNPDTGYSYRLVKTREQETRVIRGGEEAELFRVDLTGINAVVLIATEGGDGNGNDHAIWGSPILVKTDGTKVPLTDLSPKSFWVGYGKPGEPRTIGIGSKKYENSIWAHAWSEMTYEFADKYVRLEAFVGIDQERGESGSVTFKARRITSQFSEEARATTPALQVSPGNTTYYVNSGSGDDGAAGTSTDTAWKSLKRVNEMKFAAGDRILFKAGSRYRGQLKVHGSGEEGAPIVVDRYGGEERPRIDGEGRMQAAVLLSNVERWHIRNLEVTNTGAERKPHRRGVAISIHNFGVAHDIRLEGLFIHDVNGSNVKREAGGGISFGNGGGEKISYFDGLVVENCHLVRCDRNGITWWGYSSRSNWHPSLNVVVRGNLLEDIGGDCIVPIGCDGALIEHNVIRGGRMRCQDPAAGIWPWACDNTLIQFNEVSGVKGTKDGQGFDSDWNCRNSIFQYNYSHDNEGGFMLVCNDGGAGPGYSVGNVGTIIRYNISQNDGTRTFQFAGPTKDTTIHNNVIYVKEGMDIGGIFHNSWGGFADDTKFYNNIFYADGKMKHGSGESTNNVFSNNIFFGNHENLPEGVKVSTEDPMFVNSGSGGDGLDSLKGYMLKKGSPLIGAGQPMDKNTEKDFWGNSLPTSGGKLDVGAHQSPLR